MDRSAVTVGTGMDLPIMHDSDRYELVRDIGSGNFGVARLMRDKQTDELVAVKYIERGDKVSVPSLSHALSSNFQWWVPFKVVVITIMCAYVEVGKTFPKLKLRLHYRSFYNYLKWNSGLCWMF